MNPPMAFNVMWIVLVLLAASSLARVVSPRCVTVKFNGETVQRECVWFWDSDRTVRVEVPR